MKITSTKLCTLVAGAALAFAANSPAQTSGTLKWSYPTTYGIGGSGAALDTNQTAYFADGVEEIYAVNADGSLKWAVDPQYTTGDNSPALSVDGQVVYFLWYGGGLSARSITNGSEIWSSDLDLDAGDLSGPVVGPDGSVYCNTMTKLYAFSSDGRQKWSKTFTSTVYEPAIGPDGTIYASVAGSGLYGYSASGTQVAHFGTNVTFYSPSFDAAGNLYVGGTGGIYSLNPDGTQRWVYTDTNLQSFYPSLHGPSIGFGGTVYFQAGGYLYALNSDGTLAWQFSTENTEQVGYDSAPAIASSGEIYVGSSSGKIYAVRPDGSLDWTYTNASKIYTPITIGQDGTVYAGSIDGHFLAINGSTALATNNVWAKYNHDLGNSGSAAAVFPVPSAPANLAATPGNAKAVLTWNTVTGATYYNLKFATTDGGPYTTLASPFSTTYTSTGLVNGATYYYVVSAFNGMGESTNSYQVSALPQVPVPASPTNVLATAGNGRVVLTWSASLYATNYSVKRSLTSGGPYTDFIINTAALTYTNLGLTNGLTYYYVVSALNVAGESANSIQVSATPFVAIPPAAPASLTATAGNARAILTWPASVSTNVTRYYVKRSLTSGGPYTNFIAATTALIYTNTGLINGTTYYYVVTATNSVAESTNSIQVSVTPQVTAPAAPTNLTATAGNASVVLRWTTSLNATNYRVKYSLTNGGPYTNIANVSGLTYTHTGLVNGTTYYYVVSAVNAGGESTNSYQVSATPYLVVPAAPTNVTATAGNTLVVLAWSASATATNYLVRQSLVDGGPYTTILTSTASLTYTNTGLTNGTTYYYVISALNAAGESAYSSQVSAIPQLPVPGAPASVTATAEDSSVVLTWAASATATNYLVRQSLVDGGPYTTILTSTASLTYTNTGLTNGTTYYYVVSGLNASGEGAYSSQVSATPNVTTAPLTPTNVTATAGNLSVVLNWSASLNATNYIIKRSLVSGGPYTNFIANTTNLTYTDVGLTSGVTCYYVVSAVGVAGESTNSDEVSATPFLAAPSIPTNVTATAGSARVTLTWSASINASGYRIKRSLTNGGPYALVGISTTLGFVNAGLTNGTTYYYVVSATNATAESGNSVQVSAVPVLVTAPVAPTNVTATAGDSQVVLTWSASASATNYIVSQSYTNGGPYAILTSTTALTYTNTGLANGTTCYYVISAAGSGGVSGYSTQVSATPQAPGVPAAPATLTAMATNLTTILLTNQPTIVLTWSPSSGAIYYNIKSAGTSGGPYTTIGSSSDTTYDDFSFTAGTTYYYVVSAVNAVGESTNSVEASATYY